MEAEWVQSKVIPLGNGVEIGGSRIIMMVGPCAGTPMTVPCTW
jgi:hypothetical protein